MRRNNWNRLRLLELFIIDGAAAGMLIGLLHAYILYRGGLFVLSPIGETISTCSSYAGIGILGGILSAVFLWAAASLVSRRPVFFPARFFRPVFYSVFFTYLLLWAVFLAKERFGKSTALAAAGAGIIVSLVLISASINRCKKFRTLKEPGSAFRRRATAASMLAAGVVFYFTPSIVSVINRGSVLNDGAAPLERAEPEEAGAVFSTPAGKNWNLILLTIDTLRADHLGCYGYAQLTSPAIDHLAGEGIIFENAFCQRPKTSPSFASIHTGTYPVRHGISGAMQALAAENRTMAEYLHESGWRTGAVITNGNLYPAFGFDQGFEEYIHGHKDARTGADLAMKWLKENSGREKPWFLWVHFTDPHTPYAPPEPYKMLFSKASSQDESPTKRQIDLYDGEIRFCDDQVKRILQWIEEHSLFQNTVVVFTADHGESLGEHDYYFEHGLHPYEPSARIPLIIRAPGISKAHFRSKAMVGTVDILPTILDALDIDKRKEIQGKSLIPILGEASNAELNEFVYIEAGYGAHDRAGRTRALRRISTKYVHRLTDWAKRPRGLRTIFWSMNALIEGALAPDEFYNLDSDPNEINNLLISRLEDASKEFKVLKRFSAKLMGEGVMTSALPSPTLDDRTYESLKSLGYIK